jgi:leucyl/phenylalanyl-tRNA--protein transferase
VRDAAGQLVGGIYGVALGRMFFGESMFSAESGGSKLALAALARVLAGWNWPLLDAQVANPHLLRLGARQMPRDEFATQVARLTALPGRPGPWHAAFEGLQAADFSAGEA